MKLLPRDPGYVMRMWPDASVAASSRCRRAEGNIFAVVLIRLLGREDDRRGSKVSVMRRVERCIGG